MYALSNDEIVRDFPLGKTMHGKVFNVYHTQLFERSLNGQLFGDLKPFDGDAQVIEAVGWSYQPGELYGVDTVLAINVQNKVGIIRHRDNERDKAIWHRFITDMKRYHENKAQLEADYAACRDRITSVEYWKDYLGI